MNMLTFRADLQKAMQRDGFSQSRLAGASGVSQSSLSFFLSGERGGLSGENLLRLWPFVYGRELVPVQGETALRAIPARRPDLSS